ncbi:hypothetical protein [Salinirubrum litoreum]|uniref:Uncharacterized protein n=1 Tax=Salinirubrum litoreum TaxID=1126234 RepID=A0ABD5R7W2_9EURY|nr:hypothetical protein [Salinirubrum litoreum]
MDRRSFLATGVSLAGVLSAGCAGCAGRSRTSLSMVPVSDADIADRVTPRLVPREGAAADQPDEEVRLVESALAGDRPTAQGTSPPVPETEAFVADGRVYSLAHEVIESVPATTFPFTLNPVDGSGADSESIPIGELPEVDREQLAEFGLLDESDPFLGFGSTMLYLDSELPASMLVPEPAFPVLVWPEAAGRIEVDEGYDSELKTYRYTTSVVAESAGEYGRRIRADHEFRLSGLSAEERDIVLEAMRRPRERYRDRDTGGNDSTTEGGGLDDEGYVVGEDETAPPALRSLFRRFESERGLHDDPGEQERQGTYLVRFEGQVYWTEVRIGAGYTPTGSE